MAYLKARIYVENSASTGLSTGAKVAIGVGTTVVGMAGAIFAAPIILAGAGFGAAGVAGGSLAAAWQASIGNVVGGTLFASLQSAGTGLGLAGIGAASAAGAVVGGTVGGIVASGVTTRIPVIRLQKTFDIYDSDQDGYISASFLRNIINDLEVNMSDGELEKKFRNATGSWLYYSRPISYEEFLSLFGLEIYKGRELADILKNLFEKFVMKKMLVVTDDVKRMFEVLNVNASEKHVEACFAIVLGDQSNNALNLRQFLKLFGV